MCKAIESMLSESEAKGMEKGKEQGLEQGIEIGELRMLVQLVQDGDLTIARAAEKAKMTVEEFRNRVQQPLLLNCVKKNP